MAQEIPARGSRDYIDYVVNLAQGRIRQGIINEPRAFFDEVQMPAQQAAAVPIITAGNPGVFENGEQFPVRLTHMLAAVRYLDDGDNIDNQFNIQSIGLRMVHHDQYYMNPQYLPVPLWGNKVVAASDTVSFNTSAWDFVQNGQPFILSARDTLTVTVQLNDLVPVLSNVPVTIAFTGFGVLSHRPYLLSSRRELTTPVPTDFSTVDLRNDGSEPIVITDMTINVGAEDGAPDPRGDIARVSFNVRQNGNGTNRQWFRGPKTPINLPNMQATLAGVTSGRAVVHEFPGDGLIWQPGEGISIEATPLNLGDAGFDSKLVLALTGYVMVV